MKRIIYVFIFIVSNLYAQSTSQGVVIENYLSGENQLSFFHSRANSIGANLNNKNLILSFGIGQKYNNAFKNNSRSVINLGIAKDFWKSKTHYLGIELTGSKGTIGEGAIGNTKNSVVLDILYKRIGKISPFIFFETDAGIGIISNDVANFLSSFISIKANFRVKEFSLFVKNKFRVSSPFLVYKLPWIVSFGISKNI
ncbi:MAG: hypothetical protein JEY94_00020 [Melioribacteraceae bacterium]|nr:hypothetical protein [Melioribacteraceae bacterium]